ncbi:hypothetical protein [Lysobacter gummosus]|uniref:hypothetical protein n=1 Tax=Lysobacter gummosus TaxID=262324 RepID=UPI00362EAB25
MMISEKGSATICCVANGAQNVHSRDGGGSASGSSFPFVNTKREPWAGRLGARVPAVGCQRSKATPISISSASGQSCIAVVASKSAKPP